MRVGIDATCWANPRGYGRFTRELLRALTPLASQHELVCLLDRRAMDRFDLEAANVHRLLVDQRRSPTLAASSDGARSPIDLLRMTRATWHAKLDVFFWPTVYTCFPLPPGLPALVTIHDAVADRFPDLTLPSMRARQFWRAKVALGRWQARLILTVSDYAAREIVDVFRVPPSRIRVAVEAPSPEYRPSESRQQIDAACARVGLPAAARWFVYVGGFNPHKHVDAIVKAHARVVRRDPARAPFLLLVGALDGDVFHGSLARIREVIAAEQTQPFICWAGFLEDDELRHLHSGATALVLPSASEGFGLPAVEAAACGTPVIATTASPLPDLLHGGGIFVAPADVDAIAAAMLRLLEDEPYRHELAHTALRRAQALSWTRCARATLDAIEEAAA